MRLFSINIIHPSLSFNYPFLVKKKYALKKTKFKSYRKRTVNLNNLYHMINYCLRKLEIHNSTKKKWTIHKVSHLASYCFISISSHVHILKKYSTCPSRVLKSNADHPPHPSTFKQNVKRCLRWKVTISIIIFAYVILLCICYLLSIS